MPYAAEQLGHLLPVELDPVRRARRARRCTNCRAAARSTSPGSAGAPSGVRSHTAYSTTQRERAHRGLHRRVRRHGSPAGGRAGDVGHAEQLRDALGAEERRHQRLVGLLADGSEHVGDLLAGDVERRDVDRDHRVDLGVVDRLVERVLEVLGGRVGAERDRSVDDQADGRGRVGGQQAERVGVADDRDPAAAGQRLVGEQLRDVEHVLEGVDLDDPGLAEHRVDGLPAAPRSGARCGPSGHPGWCARSGRRRSACAARPGARSGRTSAGYRSTRGTSSRPRSPRPPPSTGAGRCRTRPRGCPR